MCILVNYHVKGNRGIGKEIARQLAANGVHVVITSRDEEKGRLAVQELLADGLLVKLYVADVHEINDVARMMDRAGSIFVNESESLGNVVGFSLCRG